MGQRHADCPNVLAHILPTQCYAAAGRDTSMEHVQKASDCMASSAISCARRQQEDIVNGPFWVFSEPVAMPAKVGPEHLCLDPMIILQRGSRYIMLLCRNHESECPSMRG